MPSEDPFRIGLPTFLGFTMIVDGYRRWQTAKSGGQISGKEEGILLGPSPLGRRCPSRSAGRCWP
jgi:hypothetical protein